VLIFNLKLVYKNYTKCGILNIDFCMCTVEMNFVGRTKWYPCPPKKPAIAVTFFRCCCGLNMFRAQKCNMIYDSQVSNLINVLMNLFSCLCAGCHPATSDWIEIFGWLSVRFYFFFLVSMAATTPTLWVFCGCLILMCCAVCPIHKYTQIFTYTHAHSQVIQVRPWPWCMINQNGGNICRDSPELDS